MLLNCRIDSAVFTGYIQCVAVILTYGYSVLCVWLKLYSLGVGVALSRTRFVVYPWVNRPAAAVPRLFGACGIDYLLYGVAGSFGVCGGTFQRERRVDRRSAPAGACGDINSVFRYRKSRTYFVVGHSVAYLCQYLGYDVHAFLILRNIIAGIGRALYRYLK